MIILIASIIALGIIAAVFSLLSKGGTEPVDPAPTCSTCTGEDSRCEQECMMEAATKEIEYYDDEELDRFADRPSDSFTDEEIEEFADVLYTLDPKDVKGWNRSLILRHINFPDRLKDDLLAMLGILVALFMIAGLTVSCSTQKNTSQSRFWHSFNAKYNTYYNGSLAYIDASLEKEKGNKDNFTDIIPLYTVSNKQSRELGKSNYETAIKKSQKAIKQHSIKKRPEWTKNRKKTERDIEWLNRKEYNPFIWKAWMLMGRSQFYKGAFDEAAATFSYMSRMYRTQPAIYGKARAWLAKCYIEQEWLYDAEDVIRNMSRDSIDWHAQKEWDYTMADYYVHTKDWPQATQYLRKVIKHEQRSVQRAREWYLLGQILKLDNKTQEAYKAFQKVVKQNPPYELEFNARIAMTEVMPAGHNRQKIAKLKAMARSDKNKDYLDQVYYAMGNVYLADRDTTNAITAYEKGNTKATRSGVEKGVLLLHLGNLYWEMEKFSDANRCYGEAIGLLDKDRKDYKQLSNRSKILEELVPFTEAVHLQDSLQALAKMSESDRNAAIDRVIEALKKKEKEEKKKELEQQALQQQQQNGGNDISNNRRPTPNTPQLGQNGLWYFYNPSAVGQGKQTFRQLWGNRQNADDWQRINKTVVAQNTDNDIASTDSLDADGNPISTDTDTKEKNEKDSLQNDPHKREYYLAQIPFTEEQLATSNATLADGLFHSGIIFKDKLDNLTLSEKALLRLTTDFTDFEHNDEAYYHLFLLYSRRGEHAIAQHYLELLKTSYAGSQWTTILTDPYFKENALYGTHLEDSLYASTYEAFKNDDHQQILRNGRISEQRFPLGQYRDKFIFISGLSHLNAGKADSCVNAMRRVIKEYPQSEVAGIAGMIVKGVDSGKRLHGTKFDIGSLWDRRSAVLNGEEADSTKQFSDERLTEFVYLMTYDPDSLESENQLLYELARYNFTNYLVRNFDLEIEDYDGMHRLSVSGFRNYDEAMQYTRLLFKNENVARLASHSRNIIISKQNISLLGTHFSYNDYDDFYNAHFAPLPVASDFLLNEQVIDPKRYDPEEMPSVPAKKDEEEQDESETIDNSISIDIPDESATSQPEASTIIEENENQVETQTTTIIETPSAEIEVPTTTIIETPALEEENMRTTITEIPVVKEDVPTTTVIEEPIPDVIEESSTIIETPEKDEETPTITDDNAIEISDDDAPTLRQQINSEVIEIIDEPETPSRNEQINDDEYFDFDGF